MRYTRKRLTCTNKGSQAANEAAMDKIEARYMKKMSAKGWSIVERYSGDSFLKYERVLHLSKA